MRQGRHGPSLAKSHQRYCVNMMVQGLLGKFPRMVMVASCHGPVRLNNWGYLIWLDKSRMNSRNTYSIESVLFSQIRGARTIVFRMDRNANQLQGTFFRIGKPKETLLQCTSFYRPLQSNRLKHITVC